LGIIVLGAKNMTNSINTEDLKKLVDYINMTASKAEFKMNTNEIIKYFQLLTFVQKTLIPKLEANIVEVSRVVTPKESAE